MHRACPSVLIACLLASGCGSRPGLAPLGGVAGASPAAEPMPLPRAVAARIQGKDLAAVRAVCASLGAADGGAFSPAGMTLEYTRGPFTATVIPMELDGRRSATGGPDAIVRIGDPAHWDWRLLAFVDTPAGWRLAGSIDLPGYRIGEPAPRAVDLGPGRVLLTLRTQDEHAPAAESLTTWYQVRADRLVEVLRTPAGGARADGRLAFDVTYTGELIDAFVTPQNRPAVRMRYEAAYTNARREAIPGLDELFRKRGVVTFLQDEASGRFAPDAQASPFQPGELETLLSATSDDFLRMNAARLQEMARSGDLRRRQWVGRLLLECRDCNEKTALAEELDAAYGG